jgi:hypothetical protein
MRAFDPCPNQQGGRIIFGRQAAALKDFKARGCCGSGGREKSLLKMIFPFPPALINREVTETGVHSPAQTMFWQ